MQMDTVGYSGIQWISAAKWLDIDQYRDTRDTKDTVRYRRDTGEIQAGYPKNTLQGGKALRTAGAKV